MGYGGGGGGYVPPQTYGPTQPTRQYAPSADPNGQYYSDDGGATWLWEDFPQPSYQQPGYEDPFASTYAPYQPPAPFDYSQVQPGDADRGIGGSVAQMPGYGMGFQSNPPYAFQDPGLGYETTRADDVYPSADPGFEWRRPGGSGDDAWQMYYADPNYNPNWYQDAYREWADQPMPQQNRVGRAGMWDQFATVGEAYNDWTRGEQAGDYRSNTAMPTPMWGSGDPEVAQWQGNPQWQQPSQYDVPLQNQDVLHDFLNINDPYASQRPSGGFMKEVFDPAMYPFDYAAEIGGSITDAQIAGLQQGLGGDIWGANKTSLGGFSEAYGDLTNPNEAVSEFRNRPAWQQLGYGAVFDPTIAMGGVGALPDVVRGVRRAGEIGDIAGPVMRGLGQYGSDVMEGSMRSIGDFTGLGPGSAPRMFDEGMAADRVVGKDYPAVVFHGTTRDKVPTLADPTTKTGRRTSDEFAAYLYVSEETRPQIALDFSTGPGEVLAAIELSPGTRVLDLTDEIARVPRAGDWGKGDKLLKFFHRPEITDDVIQFYRERVEPGYLAQRPSAVEDMAERLNSLDVQAWRDVLVPYAKARGYGVVRLADESWIVDPQAISRSRNATAIEKARLAEIRQSLPAGQFHPNLPIGPAKRPAKDTPDVAMPRGVDEAPDVVAARRALIDALDKEANIRKVGTAAREIHEGRVAQAGGIRGQLDEGLAEGLSGQELVDKARGGAAVGTLRRTFADAPELTPEVKTSLYNDLVRQQIDGDISEFEFLQGSVVLGKVLNGDMNLQPKQAELLRRVLGDEVVDRIIATRRADPDALTRAQEARLAAQNTAREETLLARAEKAAAQAEARATRATGTAQETLDRAAFRDKWQAISKRNDADEIRTLLADRFMTPEERSIAIKAVTRETEKAQRAAGAATDAVWAKAAKADPEAETLRRNAQEVLAKQVSDPRLRDQMERTIALWTDQNRVRLDSIKSSMPDIVNAVTGSIRAAATGQLKDSWLTAAAYRKADLVNALEAQGLETEFAKKVANAMFERELKLKYPKGVPDDIAKQVQMTKSLPYGESEGFSKLGGISQDMKNSAFGIDFGIMGQQVLHAFRYGGPNIMAGAVNELLSALHLPSVRLFGNNIPREVEMLLDGVNVGASTGISDFSRQSSMLSWLGKPGKAIDKKAYLPLADKLTDFQFRTVLGTVRRWNYEGNLLISKLAGADITNAKVRATAGDYANANTSYGRLAINTTRREAERGLLLTPSMRRAQINQILQVGKLLAPTASPQQRILAAATIASWGTSTLVIGKLLHDYAGVGDFEWDPSKPGYGNITLKNGYVINLYPQEQILKTLARSARILTDLEDSDWTELAKEWGKLAMGSSSPPLQGAEKGAGFGYQPGEGYKFGDYGDGMSPVQRTLAMLPLPTMFSNYMQGDAFTTVAGAGGIPAYKESDYTAFNRDITVWAKENNVRDDQGKLITSWSDMDPGQQENARKAGLNPPEYSGPSDDVTDARFEDYNRERDKAVTTLRQRIDAGASGRDLREAIGDFKTTTRIAGQTALSEVPDSKPDSKRELYRQLYLSADAPTKPDGTVDFDALDQERARILTEAAAAGVDTSYITGTDLKYKNIDPVVRAAILKLDADRELIEASGLWELKPTTWKQLQAMAPADLGSYATFDDFKEAYIQLLIPEYTKAGMSSAVARTQAENKVGGFPVTKRYYDLVNAQEMDWMLKNPEAATAAVEWGYWEPTKKQAGASIGGD